MDQQPHSQLNRHMRTVSTPPTSTPPESIVALNPTPYPDKKIDRIDRITPSRNRPNTPSSRFHGNVNPLFRRRISFGSTGYGSSGNGSSGNGSPGNGSSGNGSLRNGSSGNSSGEESQNYARARSMSRPCPDTTRQITYLVNTPKMMRNNAADVAMCPKTVSKEISNHREIEENRPPSPRPANEHETCVEHNKQMQVWDDWVTLTNSGVECDLASISFRRVDSPSLLKVKPKEHRPLTAEELDESD